MVGSSHVPSEPLRRLKEKQQRTTAPSDFSVEEERFFREGEVQHSFPTVQEQAVDQSVEAEYLRMVAIAEEVMELMESQRIVLQTEYQTKFFKSYTKEEKQSQFEQKGEQLIGSANYKERQRIRTSMEDLAHAIDLIVQAREGARDAASNEQLLQAVEHAMNVIEASAYVTATAMPEVKPIPEPAAIESQEGIRFVQIDTMGRPANKWTNRPAPIGEYGQDALHVDEEYGIISSADGMSAFDDSWAAAEVASVTAVDLLRTIPGGALAQQIERVLNSQLYTIVDAVNTVEQNCASTLLATRYLPWLDAVVIIDMGDGDIALDNGEEVFSLKKRKQKVINKARSSSGNRTSRIEKRNGPAILHDKSGGTHQFVRVIPLAQYRVEGKPLTLGIASDGIEENQGGSLEKQMQAIIANGLNQTLDSLPMRADDMTAGIMRLPNIDGTFVSLLETRVTTRWETEEIRAFPEYATENSSEPPTPDAEPDSLAA